MSPTHLDGRCRLSARRRLALGGTVLTSTLALALLVAPAAQAVEPAPTTVSTKSDLTTAFQSGTSKIVLGASLTDPESGTEQGIETVPEDAIVTLDLAGKSLALDRIVLGANSKLTITDSTQSTGWDDDEEDRDENALRIDATDLGDTAIELADGAHLSVTRATVRADGGDDGAGIGSAAGDTTGGGSLNVSQSGYVRAVGGDGGAGVGGGRGARAIDVTVSGADLIALGGGGGAGIGSGDGGTGGSLSTVTPTSSANYGYSSVSAEGGDDAAGIGGGRDANGGTIDLESYGTVAATEGEPSGAATASAVGAGAGGSEFGSLTVGEDARLSLSSGTTTHLPSGAVVQNTGRISLGGTIDGEGSIQNDGDIDPQRSYDDNDDPIADSVQHIAPTVQVLNHNYRVTLDPNGGTSGADTFVNVWSDTFRGYRYAEPTKTDGTVFFNWSTRADGTGEDADYLDLPEFTGASSTGEAILATVYAQYGHPAKMTATTLPDAGLGQAYDQPFPATGDGLDSFGVDRYDDQGNPIVALPPGLTLNSDTGRITGVPIQPGTYTFGSYAGNDHTSAFGTLTIEVAGAPIFATSALPAGTVGTAYATTVQATGKGRITYSIATGTLPAGLTLDAAAGRISGTPAAAGASAFVVKATSSFGSTLQPLTMSVGAPAVVPAAAPAPAAPALAAVPRTTVRFGHRLDLAVTAASTLPVTYRVVAGSLPKGISLDAATGVVSGVVTEVGGFSATIEASSAVGAARTVVAVDVPPVTELLSTASVPDVKVGAGMVPLRVKGLQKGEGWTVLVDGKPVKHGTTKKAGTLSTAVKLPKAKHDTVHLIDISGSRTVADPAERAATSVVVTSLAAKKTLSVKTSTAADGTKRVVVDRLAAGEKVTVKAKARTIAKGFADADGTFTFAQSKAGKGKRTLTVKGASAGRYGRLIVANPKH